MAWDFEAHCPECDHRWEGILIIYRLGDIPRPRDRTMANIGQLFCSYCYRLVCFPQRVARGSWARWRRECCDSESKPWQPILDKIGASLSAAPWYVRKPKVLIDADCPFCRRSMSPVRGDEMCVVCPRCACATVAVAEFNHSNIIELDDA